MGNRNPFKKDFKPSEKAERPLRVVCKLDQCAYFEGSIAPGSEIIECSHPNKPQHANQTPCPLYRLDWQKQLKSSR